MKGIYFCILQSSNMSKGWILDVFALLLQHENRVKSTQAKIHFIINQNKHGFTFEKPERKHQKCLKMEEILPYYFF